jgi:hypothetical protein
MTKLIAIRTLSEGREEKFVRSDKNISRGMERRLIAKREEHDGKDGKDEKKTS